MATYRLTTFSCFMGIFVQAVITNLTPILFIPMMGLYGFSLVHLGVLAGVNFAAQVAADILFSGIIDRKGFRFFVLPTCLVAFCGLMLYAAAPLLFANVFVGILLATILFSFSSGLLEVLLSPIIDALPGENKGPMMSFMHSFYAWGQVATIILTTLFIFAFGSRYWQVIVLLWAAVPLAAFLLFLRAPFPPHKPAETRQGMRKLLFRPFYLGALAAILCGASTEVVMNQWASAFMEKALALPKVTGDLLGMCGFAVMMGLGRLLYGLRGARIDMHRVLIGGSALAAVCYLTVALSPSNALALTACAVCGLAASLLWPGTLVVASARYPMAGAWLFAILAAAGDIGASLGNWLVGTVADHAPAAAAGALTAWLSITPEQADIRIGLLVGALFPLGALACHLALAKKARRPANPA